MLCFFHSLPINCSFLNKIVKAPKDKNKDKPLYLDSSLVKFSDTAIEALRKENEHLYNNTYSIVAHAIGFSRKDIQSDKSFKEILENKKWFSKNVDLDYLYQTRIKVLLIFQLKHKFILTMKQRIIKFLPLRWQLKI